jgi:hypothetical protein
MAGGLLQLVAVGVQDIYLIGNPQITFFKTIYKRYTNFSLESMQQVIDGRPDFGQNIQVTIDRSKGDLLKDIILDIVLPTLPQETALDAGNEYYWTNGIGNVLIKQVDLEIGGQLIDRHYSEWLDIWSQLTINESKIGAYNAMVGNYSSISSLKASAALPLRLHVPMFFWFNREYSVALPLIALQYHEITLKIKIRDFNSCYRNSVLSTQLTDYHIQSFRVWADYVHLDMEERRKFAETQHECIIEQLQFAEDEFIASSQNSVSKVLNFNHPVKELYWVHVNNDYEQQNILTGNQLLTYSIPTNLETFGEGVLQLNGIDRFEKRPANYFRLVQNYQMHTRYSSKQIYTYSFSLNPERLQPMGSCNMSKFASINLFLDYNAINPKANNMILKVYGINYNIFRIMSGMAGLSYSN